MSATANGNGTEATVHTVPPLNTIYFYLTEGCNLACRHCWLAPKFDPDATRYPVLPVELFETAIREAKPLGLTGVKLTGGEPLLHPEIVQLLEIVRREELGLTIETNGVLCTPTLAAEIARSPNPFVSVSLDGTDAATHEWVRGIRGSFDQAVRAIRNLVAAGLRPQIIMSIMRGNAEPAGGDGATGRVPRRRLVKVQRNPAHRSGRECARPRRWSGGRRADRIGDQGGP